ncbi:hypothetical protein PGQ11_009271 [Apiospora arundinis]|uniref:Uncharacterized protein n=1 Tax=Apiospora arundinis TaxID=335852 RepID=A0ABR2IHI5_9PEZI
MAPKKSNGNGTTAASGDEITAADMEFMTAYFKLCTPASKPEPVNFDELGAMFKINGKKNLMQRFNRIAAKKGWFQAEGPAVDTATPPKKNGGRPKKNAATTASTALKTSKGSDGVADEDNTIAARWPQPC